MKFNPKVFNVIFWGGVLLLMLIIGLLHIGNGSPQADYFQAPAICSQSGGPQGC